MKRIFTMAAIAVMAMAAASCGSSTEKSAEAEVSSVVASVEAGIDSAKVAVVYFHGDRRCKTCVAVEKNARATVEKLSANGANVKFFEVNADRSEATQLVTKYQVVGSSLLVIANGEVSNITSEFFPLGKDGAAFEKALTEWIGLLTGSTAE
ncbi:MAG: thioredoxin family protein [Bacteroidales bacterium]|nr:thioredoxin family protein [Bacteroidales bacterium]MBN2750990.1 thioredoxin family protein [Bacteroidales bacterium]